MSPASVDAEVSRARASDLIERLRKLARHRLNSDLADDRRSMPPFAVLELSRLGLLGMTQPAEEGGAGLLTGDALRVLRQLSAIDLSLALLTGLHNFLSSAPILEHAGDSVRSEWAGDLISGRRLASFALTEEGAGSDPRRMAALAEQQEDGSWVISGRKIWSGAAAWAGIALVFAHAKDRCGALRGITAFAVPLDSPEVVHGTEARTLGLRAVVQSAIHLEGARVPDENMVGTLGGGLAVAQGAMMRCRLVCSVFAAGAMMRCLQAAWRYVGQRTISSGLMAENPAVRQKLEGESLRCHALNCFLEDCFDRLDGGCEPSAPIYLASKIVGPEQAWICVDSCLQLLGGRGYLEPNVVSRMARDVRVLRVFEGPTEALASHLGSLLGSRPEEVRSAFCSELDAADLWERLGPLADESSPRLARARGVSREDLLEGQSRAGLACAHLLFLAVVRRRASSGEAADEAAAAWTEALVEEVLASVSRPSPRYSGAAGLLGGYWNGLVGEVDEKKGGDDWLQDPLLRA